MLSRLYATLTFHGTNIQILLYQAIFVRIFLYIIFYPTKCNVPTSAGSHLTVVSVSFVSQAEAECSLKWRVATPYRVIPFPAPP